GIGGIGIAAQLPKTENIAVEKGDFTDELRAFPGVTLRNDHPGRTTVLFGDRLAVPLVRDEHVVVHANLEWIVGGITIVTLEENVGGVGLRFDEVGDREKRHPFEFHIKLAPGSNTVEITDILELRQGQELVPFERDWIFHVPADLQFPFVEGNVRTNSEIENGEIMDFTLPGGQTIRRA